MLKGSKELQKQLNSINKKVAGVIGKATLRAGLVYEKELTGQFVKGGGTSAKTKPPVADYPTTRTGNLEDSIQANIATQDRSGGWAKVRVAPDNKGQKMVEYAHRIEYGFIGLDSMGRYIQQMPRPIFRRVASNIIAEEKAKTEFRKVIEIALSGQI